VDKKSWYVLERLLSTDTVSKVQGVLARENLPNPDPAFRVKHYIMYLRHAGRENEFESGDAGWSHVKPAKVNMSFPASLLPYPFTVSLQRKHQQL
jgi:hypothetical protein